MRRKRWLRVGMVSLLLSPLWIGPVSIRAQALGVPQLVVSQLKVTSSAGQFVTLYNQSETTLDLSQFEIDYLSSSGKLSSLPVAGQLAPHGYYMLSDDQVRLCYQVTVNAVSLGFATTSGALQVWSLNADKTAKQLEDSVSWANKVTTGAVTLPTQNSSGSVSLLRQPTDAAGGPQLTGPSAGGWQAVTPDVADPCVLDVVNTTTPVASPVVNPGNQLSIGQAPPATIISLVSDDSSAGQGGPSLPSSDVGRAAPQLTELLPNPLGAGNDDSDEYIELYNSNPTSFDLSGFTLQTGTTTKHNYVFPAGTLVPPQSFTALFSTDTGLSLSNSGGQADLLDPFGNTLSRTDAYGTAKDGQAWALANGHWYWTTQATPGAANVVKQVVTSASSKTKTARSKAGKGSGAVKGASTATAATAGSAASGAADATAPAPIHPYVLAAVAALAVGYGVYEYRHDLGNRFHQFRTNRAARRAARR